MTENSKKFITNSKNFKIVTELTRLLDECDEFIISVAFVTLSGVVCIIEALSKLRAKNVKGKILTGCYLNFTEPKALQKLLEFENIELKVLDDKNFHAKGFFFRSKQNWQIMLGSSNLTQSALTVNNEWNLIFKVSQKDSLVKQILGEFNYLFAQAKCARKILDEYTQTYQSLRNLSVVTKPSLESKVLPNKVQRQALNSLEALRLNGRKKALVISATGTGKTFLSAFDVAKIKPKRCLFVVHRTNIAIKAKQTFSKLIKDRSLGLYTGAEKTLAQYLFATIQTLKNSKVLASFKKNTFDYIVIDEVHHAEAESYKKVLDYFKTKFLLGMTATPERTDNADIFKLFDYNIAYEIRLNQALDQDLLCPFHYFAIQDFYLESEKLQVRDFAKLISDNRVDHIVEKMDFYGYSGQHRAALMFVSSVDEARQIAIKLTTRGIKAKSLTSQDAGHVREKLILELESYKLEVIVTVDVFNEGVDIPCLNQIILLRPTQSTIVYVQQLGRGLRKFKDKKFVVILDFIANYKNNFLIPVALSQNNSYDKDELKKFVLLANNYIAGKSTVTFSNIARELIYNNIQKTNFSQLKNIKRDYKQLKKKLGRIPSLVDFERHNFISPEVILATKDTYYDILQAFKENICTLNKKSYDILRFISREFTPAKRLYEILIIENLLAHEAMEISQLETNLKAYLQDFDKISFDNALKHLSLQIFKVNAGRQDYKPLINVDGENIKSQTLSRVKESKFLDQQLKDLLKYNKLAYTLKYARNKHYGLSMYAKYTKKDIAHLLNQDYTNGGVNLAGYRVFDSTALLFMTFDESKKFTLYDNKFISPRIFTYYSKNGRSLNDSLEKGLADNKYLRYVFARVSKSGSYFYLGTVSRCLEFLEISGSNKMVKYTFELSQTLSSEIWQYFRKIYRSKNCIISMAKRKHINLRKI